MTTYLLDTSVIIDVLNGKRNRDALLKGLLDQGDLLACCPVNISEVYAGMRPKEQAATEAFLQSLDYYEITWDVAKRAGLLKRDYSKKGQTLSLPDTTIAAVALEYNLTLITDNVKHYPMPQLKLYTLDH
ncbi:MAG: type II toxin-antitoxin system VapC family toxin [Blastocatellia bacterium]